MKNKLKENYNKLTIGKKITFIHSSVFILMIIIVSIIAFLNMWISYTSVSKSEINATADKIEEYITNGGTLDKTELEDLIDNPYIDVRIFNRSKKWTKDIGTMKNPDMFPGPDVFNAERNGNEPGINRGDLYGRNNIENTPYMFMHRVFEYNGDTFEIIIFRKNTAENKSLYVSLIIIIITNLISILFSLIIGKYISIKTLAPIREVTEAAESISLYDLTQRIAEPKANDEVKALVITFNDMIDRLQENFNKENQFISDASHELKTPIAIIQGYINMIDRWGKDDPEILNESIESIKSETEHMNKLIQQLLYLARDSQGRNQINITDVSLGEIAEDVARELEVSKPEIVTTFINESDDDIIVKADKHMLKQLIWIFAENGIKYAGDKKCHITIKIGINNSKPYFSVTDNGIGIDKKALSKIFDRFYRYDESRNKKIEGNGLGLSIAKAIVKQLNAKIDVKSEIGNGSTFTVTFYGNL